MDIDLIKDRTNKAIKAINACKWHEQTLKALMDKEEISTLSEVKEPIPIKKKTFQVSDIELETVYAQAGNATPKQLEARKNHFYYYDEYLSILARIDALEGLIEQYTKSIINSQEEETKFITDPKMLAMFTKIGGLKNVDKGQLITVKSMREEFDSRTVQGREDRYKFFLALENIYNQNC